jgi:hypothetical protein
MNALRATKPAGRSRASHPRGQTIQPARDWVGGIHVHDSFVVIDKRYSGEHPDKSFRGGPASAGKA